MNAFVFDTCVQGLACVCVAAWKALPLLILVVILARTMRRHVSSQMLCLLWMLVVIRFLLPDSIPSRFAISTIPERIADKFVLDRTIGDQTFEGALVERGPSLNLETNNSTHRHGRPLWATGRTTSALAGRDEVETGGRRGAVEMEALGQSDIWSRVFSLKGVVAAIAGVWATGAAFLLVTGVGAYSRFSWHLRRLTAADHPELVQLLAATCQRLGLRRPPRIQVTNWIATPAVFGVFRPVVCMPIDWRTRFSDPELAWVMRHELSHVIFRHGLMLALAEVACALHWFHPMAWYVARRLRLDAEKLADRIATRDLSEVAVGDYGGMLIRQVERGDLTRPFTLGVVAMASGTDLRERIHALSDRGFAQRGMGLWGALPALLVLAWIGLTDAQSAPPKPEINGPSFSNPITSAYEANGVLGGVPDPAVGDRENAREVLIPIEELLRKFEKLQPTVDAERAAIVYLLPYGDEWDTYRASTKIDDGVLTARLTPKEEYRMRCRIAAIAESGLWQVVCKLRFLELATDSFNEIDWSEEVAGKQHPRLLSPLVISDEESWNEIFADDDSRRVADRGNRGLRAAFAGLPARIFLTGESTIDQITSGLHGGEGSLLLSGPNITLFNGDSASVRDVTLRPFVTDLKAVSSGQTHQWEPQITIIPDGYELGVFTKVMSDREIAFRMVCRHSKITGVKLAELPGLPDTGEGRKIQSPEIQAETIVLEGKVPEGETIAIYSPVPYEISESAIDSSPEKARGRVVLISFQLIADDFLKEMATPSEKK